MGGPIENLVLNVSKATFYLALLAVLLSIIMFWQALTRSSPHCPYNNILFYFCLLSFDVVRLASLD